MADRNRKFYDVPLKDDSLIYDEDKNLGTSLSRNTEEEDLLALVEKNVVGKRKTFSGPFGLRKGISAKCC